MAKGRRYKAERLLAAPADRSGGGGGADLPDLSEGDVWPDYRPTSHDDSAFGDVDVDGGRDPGRRTRHAHPQRWVERHVGGLTLAFEDVGRRGPVGIQPVALSERHRGVAASAPVDVPVWRRTCASGPGGPTTEREEDEEEEEENSLDGGWLPPHEYLARTPGRRSMATSVLEGAGRTLKGRDMRRVRDAVWSKTGFFG